MAELREYGVADYVYFPLIDFNDTDFEKTPVTFEDGDVQISKDGAAFVNTTNLPTYVGNGIYRVLLSATEKTAKKIIVSIIDQTPIALWEDQAINIETYGDTSAQHTTIYFGGTASTVIPSAPGSISACRIYEYLFKPDGVTPYDTGDVKGHAEIVSLPHDSGSALHGNMVVDGVYNSTTGLIYWDIVQGAVVKFKIFEFGVNVVKTIPSSATVRLTDIA